MSGGGAEGEGDTESEAGSRLQAVSAEPKVGLKPVNHDLSRSWRHNRLSHPGAHHFIFYVYLFLRQRQSMSGGGAEREGDRIRSRLQALSHQLRAQRGARTRGP